MSCWIIRAMAASFMTSVKVVWPSTSSPLISPASTQRPNPIYTASPPLAPADSVPVAPQTPARGALAQDADDHLVRDLRSALSQSEAARRLRLENEITLEQAALDRQRRRKWIL